MDTMQRNRIISAGGTSFFSQFRNGFRTILSEVSKLETILADPEQPLESTYFEVESAILENANLHYDNVHQLHTTVSQEPINLDSIEERLQAIRSKLISLEEDPVWLKKGYQPYVPPEIIQQQTDEPTTPERANGSAVMELSFGTPHSANGNGAYPVAPQTPNLSHNSIESAGCTPKAVTHSGTARSNGTTCPNQTKQFSLPPAPAPATKPEPEILISDPKLAKCLNILNRWKNVESSSGDPMVRKDTFIKPTDEESSVASLKGSAFPLSNKKPASFSASPTVPTLTSESLIKSLNPSAHKFKPTAASIHRSKTFTMESKAKVKPFTGGQFDYETVEFTPGMTSKVIRK